MRTNRFEDDDSHRLPLGMKRVGYDEGTERYTFRQGDDLWLGEPGSFYGGTLKWAGKAPDACSPSDDEEEKDDENYNTAYTGTRSNGTSFKHRLSSVHGGARSLSCHQESRNEWGVPIASISDTNAKPPDMTLGRRGTQLKKVAKSTATAISVTRRWSRKKLFPRGEDQRGSSGHQAENPDKNGFRLGTDSFSEKELLIPPAH